jgi:hypothetical protein
VVTGAYSGSSYLGQRLPDIARAFKNGLFVVRKTQRLFSAISLDQAHEQLNAFIKRNGGVVGLAQNDAALRKWMVAAPETHMD